jgi:DNA-directed RNA polymerase subunit omega
MDFLMDKFGGSKYTLVAAVSKRARQLTEGDSSKVDPISNKPVLIALQEIAAGMVAWERPKGGIK